MSVRDICADLVRFLTAEGVFKRYTESGRYAVNGVASGRFQLDDGTRMLLHYGSCQGALYEDVTEWRQVQRLVHTFTAAGVAAPGYRPWMLETIYGSLGSAAPSGVLTHFESSLAPLGFSRSDRNDARSTATFRMEESAAVMDLPEPYGKWFQHREQRARWQEPVNLVLTVEARVVSRLRYRPGQSGGEYETQLEAVMSAPAVNFLAKIYEGFARALQIPRSSLHRGSDLRRSLIDKVQQRIGAL